VGFPQLLPPWNHTPVITKGQVQREDFPTDFGIVIRVKSTNDVSGQVTDPGRPK
jgi:hypothetical protein